VNSEQRNAELVREGCAEILTAELTRSHRGKWWSELRRRVTGRVSKRERQRRNLELKLMAAEASDWQSKASQAASAVFAEFERRFGSPSSRL
jgi:hypothetical protein